MPLFKVWSEDKLSKKFVFLNLLFLLVACDARRLSNLIVVTKLQSRENERHAPRGFGASFRSFATFSARSNCLNRQAMQAIFWRSSLFTYIIRDR